MTNYSLGQRFKRTCHHQIGIGCVTNLFDQHLLAQLIFFQILGQLEILDPIKERDDFLVGAVIQGTQKSRQKEFPTPFPAIQMNVEKVRRIVGHLQPRATIWNDPVAVQQFSVGMHTRLKTDTWGPVELADDHPLRSVHHKSALLGHQGELTHVDPLFNRRPVVMQNEGNVERGCIGCAFPQTLDRAIFGLPKLVMTKVEFDLLVVRLDREDFTEDGLKADITLPLLRVGALLEEGAVGVQLNLHEVRHLHRFGQPPEIYPLDFGRFRHAAYSLSRFPGGWFI